MIKIIGTTHLTSKEEIEKIIVEEKPDVIGVELCEVRFKIFTGQIDNSKSEKDETLLGQIAEETKRKAKEENLDYGSDMKSAMYYAINNNINLELLDRSIMETRTEMLKIPLEEQVYLQKELIKFQTEKLEREINEEEIIEKMKKDIPVSYKILVEERDNYIINKLKNIRKKYENKKILVFLGKGHVRKVEESMND